MYSALLIGGAVFGAYLLATGNATIALFAVALAGTGLLTIVPSSVSGRPARVRQAALLLPFPDCRRR